MSKLYPPDIGGVIPSFYGEYINIPFTHNKLVDQSNIIEYSLVIKSVNNNKLQDQITSNVYIDNNSYTIFTKETEQPEDWKEQKQRYYTASQYQKIEDLTQFLPNTKYYIYENNEMIEQTQYQKNTDYYITIPGPAAADLFIKNIKYYTGQPIEENNIVSFGWPTNLKRNMYYKIQMAYISRDEKNQEVTGYYSDVAVVRHTSEPRLAASMGEFVAIGTYFNSDPVEKVYEYCFNIYNTTTNTLCETSGWLLHNSNQDNDSTSSKDEYYYKNALDYNNRYKCEYLIKTVNKMEEKAEFVLEEFDVQSDNLGTFSATRNIDEGRIVLNFRPNNKVESPEQYIIKRYCNKDNYSNGIKLYEHKPKEKTVEKWYDYSAEQGYKYRYELYYKKSNGSFYQHNTQTSTITSEFEDMFLSDNERQLKIRFNPKVSSFKQTILETKTDTIGGQFPFFFRNGNVGYKEFPISGMISYNMDTARLFMDRRDLFLPYIDDSERLSTPADEELAAAGTQMATDLTNANILSERIFKTEVLDWLNNGKPKLFRSPTEGNFIVRLMNVSLSPNDTLGRMLHTFSATAYEIAECTPENLRAYNVFFEGRQ